MTKELKIFFDWGLGIWLGGTIFFSIFFFIDLKFYTLVLGWTFGSMISLVCFLMNVYLSKIYLSKMRGKVSRFFMGLAKFFASILLSVTLIFLMVFINPLANGHNLFENVKTSDMFGPINLFTTLAGLAVVMVGIFLAHFFELRAQRTKSLKIIKNHIKVN